MRCMPVPMCGQALRCLPALCVLAAGVALTGCDTVVVGKVDPAMFPPAAAASAPPWTGRVALDLMLPVRGKMHPAPAICGGGRAHLQLPLGDIVDAALQRELGASFTGGAAPAALPLTASSDATVALSVVEIRLSLDHKLNWVVPIPLPVYPFIISAASSMNYSARMELDLRISDALGRLLAQTTLDSGTVLVERGQWTSEPPDQRCLKLTHQAASQAAAQAARVLREALQAERQRERSL